jgi:hypothetical protein
VHTRLCIACAVTAAATLFTAPSAVADDLFESQGYRKGVTPQNIATHLAAFQSFADASGSNRVAGSAGHRRTMWPASCRRSAIR